MQLLFFSHDGRAKAAAEAAAANGHTVRFLSRVDELTAAENGAPILYVLPIPVTRDGVHFAGTDIPLSALQPHPSARLCGGGIPPSLRERFTALAVLDVLEDEVFTQGNARLTAEGGVAAALQATERGIWGLSATVFGFGRIGRYVAHLLRGLDLSVTVVARRPEVLAEADGLGYATRPWRSPMTISDDLVFGTVPVNAYAGVCLSSRAVCIDLGGGMPDRLPTEHGELTVTAARGVPAVFAPRAAGKLLYACLERLTTEELT